MDRVNPVLAQKLGIDVAAGESAPDARGDSPMRLMRRAVARAADKAAGLSSTVLGISEEELDAEAVIDDGPAGWVVLGLRDQHQAGLTGLFLLDPVLRSALVDMQTMGNLMPPADEPRPVTTTDAVMTVPFAEHLLRELSEVGFGAPAIRTVGYDLCPMPDMRTAGLVMVQGSYAVWRVTLQLGGTEAQGEVFLALRPIKEAVAKPAKAAPGWAEALQAAVEDAPAELNAVLGRMSLPIRTIESFEVGQVLRLPGTTVQSVVLEGPGGQAVGAAHLGQVAGKRAVRIERHEVTMEEAPPPEFAAQPEPAELEPPSTEGQTSPDGDAVLEDAAGVAG